MLLGKLIRFVRDTATAATVVRSHVYRPTVGGRECPFDATSDQADVAEFISALDDAMTVHSQAASMYDAVWSLSRDEMLNLQAVGFPRLRDLVREGFLRYTMTTGKRLSWIAVIHDDKLHPHVHVCIKAVSYDLYRHPQQFRLRGEEWERLKSEVKAGYDVYAGMLISEEAPATPSKATASDGAPVERPQTIIDVIEEFNRRRKDDSPDTDQPAWLDLLLQGDSASQVVAAVEPEFATNRANDPEPGYTLLEGPVDVPPVCPKCGRQMNMLEGRFGPFWGCTGFPRCKASLKIRRAPRKITLQPLTLYEPDEFLNGPPLQRLLADPTLPTDLQAFLTEIRKGNLKGQVFRSQASALFRHLFRSGEIFTLAQWAYCFYVVEGWQLPEKLDYFLGGGSTAGVPGHDLKEREIERAVAAGWTLSPFATRYGLEYLGRQVSLPGGVCDILARSSAGHPVAVEFKAPSMKHRDGVGQALHYRTVLKSSHGSAAAYIVAKGFPRYVFDATIGTVGYVIEGDRLALIPWSEAKTI